MYDDQLYDVTLHCNLPYACAARTYNIGVSTFTQTDATDKYALQEVSANAHYVHSESESMASMAAWGG
jgi:hypothetical protein